MAQTYSVPGPSGFATTTDFRKNLSGLIVADANGNPRPGVFPSNASALVASRTDMNVNIAAFQAVAVQFGGAILLANDGTAQLPSPLVSPGAGTNYYVIYVKQNESASPGTDVNNNRVFGAAMSTSNFGTARASGARLDGSGTGLPAGAVELATVEMPASRTATNQSGVVITQTFQYTSTRGGAVWFRNQSEQDAWAPADGGAGYRMDLGVPVVRTGGAWKRVNTGHNLITATTFTGQATVALDGVFSTLFDAYTLEFEAYTIAAKSIVYGRLRNAGAAESGAAYYRQILYAADTTVAGTGPTAATNMWQLTTLSGDQVVVEVKVRDPAAARRKTGFADAMCWDTAVGPSMNVSRTGMGFGGTGTYDGFQFFTNGAQVMTGRVRVYGHYAG